MSNVTKIVQDRLGRTRSSSRFWLGFEHEIRVEIIDRYLTGEVIVILDGEEIVRESMWKLMRGYYKKHFDIEKEKIGMIEFRGYVLGFSTKISVNGTVVLEL